MNAKKFFKRMADAVNEECVTETITSTFWKR